MMFVRQPHSNVIELRHIMSSFITHGMCQGMKTHFFVLTKLLWKWPEMHLSSACSLSKDSTWKVNIYSWINFNHNSFQQYGLNYYLQTYVLFYLWRFKVLFDVGQTIVNNYSQNWKTLSEIYNFVCRLNEEINDFFKWMVPTPEEHQMRITVVEKIEHCIQVWFLCNH